MSQIDSIENKRRQLREAFSKKSAPAGAQAITPQLRPAEIPASQEQRRMWVQMAINGSGSHFHVPHVLEISGLLDTDALSQALKQTLERHEALRTTFSEHDGRLCQRISTAVEPSVSLFRHPESMSDGQLSELIANDIAQPFDLAQGPLLRASLHQVGDARQVLVLTAHHLVADGWSLDLILSQLWRDYAALSAGEALSPPCQALHYADYALWQQGQPADCHEDSLRYWQTHLAGAPTLELPLSLPRPARRSHQGELHFFSIGTEYVQRAQTLARQQGTTLFTVMLAAWRCLLADVSGQDDFCVGTTGANRQQPGSEGIVGFFANLLALRTTRRKDDSFASLLEREHATVLNGLTHQGVSFDQVVERVAPPRDASRTPLFQVNFVLQNTKDATAYATATAGMPSELAMTRRDDLYRYAQFDLTLFAEEMHGDMRCCLVFRADLFQAGDIGLLAQSYLHYLDQLTADAARPLTQLDRVSPAMLGLLDGWQRNDAGDRLPTSIGEVMNGLARTYPDKIAIRCGDAAIDYASLSQAANRLARHIQDLGVEPGAAVGLCLEPGVELIVAMLAVLNAGCAYVPLDTRYPADRLQFLIEDSCASIIITSKDVLDQVDALQDGFLNLLVLEEEQSAVDGRSEEALNLALPAQMPAYLMYTSGTTSKPKGVVVPQQAILRLAHRPDFIEVKPDDVFLQFAPTAFDAATFEIWAALLNGATLVIPAERSASLDQLGPLLQQEGVTVLWLTSGLFTAMVDHSPESLKTLRYLICGGDVLSLPHVQRAQALLERGRLVNGYGPTETTTFAATCLLEEWREDMGPAPIGKPIRGTSIYVLDGELNLLPPGAAGDIYIGGLGLAHGYRERPELTADAFLPDPFSGIAGARMYRSGDVGRWDCDGRLHYLGRRDRQLKLRGYRIEPTEVESALLQCSGVEAAVVLIEHTPHGDKQLVGYWTRQSASGAQPDEASMRQRLRERLPDYMVPGRFCLVPRIPLTANGKLDREALLQLAPARGKETMPPADLSELEARLYPLWSEVLGREGFSVEEGFFDLGGDSLLAIRLKALAQEAGLEFEIQDLFTHQSIRSLGLYLEQRHPVAAPAAATVNTPPLLSEQDRARLPDGVVDAYPLSRLQLGMLYHSLRHENSSLYHDVIGYEVAHPCIEACMQATLASLAARHPVLRSALDMDSFAEPMQLVMADVQIPLQVDDLQVLTATEQTDRIADFMESERFVRFDPAAPPLLRCFAFRLRPDCFKLIWSFHHAMLDGWSEASLTTEFIHRYLKALAGEAMSDEPEQSGYSDFIRQERAALADSANRDFWRRLLDGAQPLSLRRSASEPSAEERVGYLAVPVSGELAARLQALAKAAGAPLKSVLLTAHMLALQALTGRRDVITSMVTHVRPETEGADKVIGLFLNSVPVRIALDPAASAIDHVRAMFRIESDIFRHRFYPSQQIRQDNGGLEIGEVLFNFTSFHVLKQLDDTDLAMLSSRDGHAVNSFPIQVDFSVSAGNGQLVGVVSYRRDSFQPDEAEDLAHALHQALRKLTGETDIDWLRPQVEAGLAAFGTPPAIRGQGSIGQRLYDFARATPDAQALIDGSRHISYAQLQRRCERIAEAMAGLGIRAGNVVAICAGRSAQTLLTVLATLRLGAVYLPLEPSLPEKRHRFMLDDAEPALIIADETAPEYLHQAGIPCVGMAALPELGGAHPEPAEAIRPESAGYILYTSGSTGTPKGVLCRQEGILALFDDLQRHYPLSRQDRVLWKTSMSFDVSLTEMLWPLLKGASVVVAKLNGQYDPGYLSRLIVEQKVSVVNFVPSMLHLFLQAAGTDAARSPLRAIFAAGEALLPATAELAARLLPDTILFNAYGPTEASIYATIWRCQGGMALIGKAVGAVGTHILAPDLSRLPIGVAGELCLSGRALASGYLNRADLTAERFVSNPYATGSDDAWLYRTGDIVRFQRNGDIEFIGRNDDQVKVRGFRIETGEVESALGRHPSVAKVAALVMRRDSGAVLCAFVEKSGEQPLGPVELKRHAQRELPGYMVPDVIVEMETLPMTVSGKIDRQRLADWDIGASPQPRLELNQAEAAVSEIWREVLSLSTIDPDANFFDVGGHSLALIQCQGKLRNRFGRDIEIAQLFHHSTIRSLARWLSDANAPLDAAMPKDESANAGDAQDIAIIGISARFPGADDVEQFWTMLLNGQDGITRMDNDGLRAAGVPDVLLADPHFVAARGMLKQPECFDAAFFGYTPREAEIMDPQQRKLLEESYRALEDAGYATPELGLDIGVYVGLGASDYLAHHVLGNQDVVGALGLYQINLINQSATQIAYRLNLTGPAVTLNTACSTSLVAVHMACKAVLNGECQLALAGAASVSADGQPGYLYRSGGIFSADGYCRAFDAAASGTIEGNGAGAVVLKRRDHALRDGDNIYAVIKGSAINNDGRHKAGYTAPSPEGQRRVIHAALAASDVAAESVGYVETHGTGTALGDPIEMAALRATYGQRPAGEPCLLGAVKTSIGHLDSAAGLAGVIKVAMTLRHGRLPGTLHFSEPNPLLELEQGPFSIPIATQRYTGRYAAVSSFGIGGTNAHIILETPPVAATAASTQSWHTLKLSAKTPQALQRSIARLANTLDRHPEWDLADVAYTLQTGRGEYLCRASLVAENRDDAAAALREGRLTSAQAKSDKQPLIFLFTGQGGQVPAMARELYVESPAFRAALDEVCDLFREKQEIQLLPWLLEDRVAENTAIVQPMLFAYEYALFQTWEERGVRPDYLIGHSLGELTAACCAGIFSLEDAVSLIAVRASAMQAQPAGAMLAVSITEAELRQHLPSSLSVAAINAPLQVVVSGPTLEIESFASSLVDRGIAHSRLASSHAFHSPMMAEAAQTLAAHCATIRLNAQKIPMASNLTGKLLEPEQAVSPEYWADQMLQAVRFSDGVRELAAKGDAVWLEIGPRDLLAAQVRAHRLQAGESVLASFPERAVKGARALQETHARLWCLGAKLEHRDAYDGERRLRLPLPGYPFEPAPHWLPRQTALSAPSPHKASKQAPSPRSTEVESAACGIRTELAKVWTECLGYKQVNGSDNFFELGGDSLLAGRMLSRIQERLQVELSLADFFGHPTIDSLSRLLESRRQSHAIGILAPTPRSVVQERTAPLSFQQTRLWTLERLGMGGSVFHLPQCLHLKGPLDPEALAAALTQLLARHPALRTSIHTSDDGMTGHQRVHDEMDMELERLSFSGTPDQMDEFIRLQLEQLRSARFQMENAPLFRARLLQLKPGYACLLMVFHHIAVDGWSFRLIAQDLALLYERLSTGKPIAPSRQEWDYAAYSEDQAQRFASGQFEAQRQFWQKRLSRLPVLDLGIERRRERVSGGAAESCHFEISPEQMRLLEAQSRRLSATPYVVFLAAFLLMLSRQSGQKDIIIGSPIANRMGSRVEPLVGFFVNMLALRMDLSQARSLRQWLDTVRQTVLEAQTHQDYPFEKLVEEHAGPRNASLTPLFQAVFSMQEEPTESMKLGELEVLFDEVKETETEYDLTINMFHRGSTYGGMLQHRAGLFEAERVEQMRQQFLRALDLLLSLPDDTPIEQLTLLSDDERTRLLAEGCPPAAAPAVENMVSLLADAFSAGGDAIAVASESGLLTYRELSDKVERTARELARLGVRPGDRVGLCLEPSIDALVTMLGVLRAGASYLPLDPTSQASRWLAILAQAPVALLVHGDRLPGIDSHAIPLVTVASLLRPDVLSASSPLPPQPGPDQTAYTLFTSGSTGAPKGVEVSHRAAALKIQALSQAYRMTPSDRALQFSSLIFDVSIEEIFTTLFSGGRLLIHRRTSWSTMAEFNQLLESSGATMLNLPASFWREWVESMRADGSMLPSALRLVVTGSEKVHISSVQAWRQLARGRVELLNAYGLTESVITSIVHRVDAIGSSAERDVAIGKPLPGTRAYVLDEHLQPTAPFARGQLYLGGTSLADGYLNRPDLTAAAFLSDPFNPEPGAKMYRTGDMVRRDAEGNLFYLGRMDRQVKVRGIRVELSEIESALLDLPGIKEAAVHAAQTPDEQSARIDAYVVLAAGSAYASPRELLQDMRRRVPAHLMPASLAILKALPKTTSDKLDLQKLAAESTPPLCPEEGEDDSPGLSVLRKLLQKMLRHPVVRGDDNYFALGGDSILLLRTVAQLNRQGWTLAPQDFFHSATVADLARCLKPLANQKQETGLTFPLTPYQRQILLRGNPRHWNRSLLLRSCEGLQPQRLREALATLLKSHPGLRCVFDSSTMTATTRPWVQGQEAELFSSHDFSMCLDAQASMLAHTRQLQEGFDLEHGPLVRMAHYRLSADEERLFIVIHGLVADSHGWSVLLGDLERAYGGDGKGLSGSDTDDNSFGEYQRALAKRIDECGRDGSAASYFSGMKRNVALPQDLNGRNSESSQRTIRQQLDAETADQLLIQLPAKLRIKAATAALAAAGKTLTDWAGGPVVADVGRHGRDWLSMPSAGQAIGCFVCDVPVCLPDERGRASLQSLQDWERMLAAPTLAALAFSSLPDELAGDASWHRCGRPQVSLDYVSAPAGHGSERFEAAPEATAADRDESDERSHLLNLVCLVTASSVTFECRYSQELHSQDTAEWLLRTWLANLKNMLAASTDNHAS
ncbi:amino acid adenylation domain-containing protein [Chromobacterium amazonense]|uniref:non-ribosomal peptide synthetase/type I polyketide synthase n=1 Tax=Chromobacterium amazonense TaxID=1382803 RepID=UPI00237DC725|nr:non-ribosomal peptide synthetase/type I polyketide synthase [Chromobacterium amazonense]MDE1715951.1 amino acid adenylation domain-containing protein [Chromobacterium amazonense]